MKQRVVFLQSIAGEVFSYRPGEVAELDPFLADVWRAAGILKFEAVPVCNCPHCGGKLDDAVFETATAKAPETATFKTKKS